MNWDKGKKKEIRRYRSHLITKTRTPVPSIIYVKIKYKQYHHLDYSYLTQPISKYYF